MNLLVFDSAAVPASAKGFHQIDRTDHLLAEQLRFQPLTGEQSGLRGDDVEVVGGPAYVAIVGDGELAAGVFDGGVLGGERLRKRAQIADAIFYLLKGGENSLAIIRYRLVVGSAGGGEVCALSSAFEDRCESAGAERPEQAGRVEQRRNVDALIASGAT